MKKGLSDTERKRLAVLNAWAAKIEREMADLDREIKGEDVEDDQSPEEKKA